MAATDTQHTDDHRIGSNRAEATVPVTILTTLLVVLILGVHWRDATPTLSIPQRTVPSPNAFDDFQAATQQMPAGRSRAAAGAVWANLEVPSYNPSEAKKPSEAARAELVRQYGPALERLRAGLGHAYREPPARSFVRMYPHLARYRDLSRILRLEGQVRATRGDWAGAMESTLDTLQMGTRVVQGNHIIGGLVGAAIQMVGRKDAWQIAEHLSGSEARTATERLECIRKERFPYWRTLEEEKWATLAGLLEIMRRPDWQGRYVKTMIDAGQPVAPRNPTTLAHLVITSKGALVNEYSAYMDRSIAQARVPYAKRSALVPLPSNTLAQMVVPRHERAHFTIVKSEVLNDLLLLSLALRAYQAKHGQPPRALSALVPRYLKALPEDPFAPDGKFRYRVEKGRPLLYSIGPDATDDGGCPVLSKPTSADPAHRHRVGAESTGDIVAGVNVQ